MFLRFAVAVAALSLPSVAMAEWWEARTDHFIVYSESNAKDAKSFAERLERYDRALRSLQNIKADSQPDREALNSAGRAKIVAGLFAKLADDELVNGEHEQDVD